MYTNDIKKAEKNQMKILSDKDKKGKERPWREKKLKSLELSKSYERIGNKRKASRVKKCSSQLIYKKEKTTGNKKLHSMISCQVRLCPLCNWRRSLKIYGQTSKVMDEALKEKEYRFVFLTLTCKNIYSEDLSQTIDNLFHSFKKLTERKQIKKVVKGWFRALEVTHNLDDKSKYYNTYHPHFHIILMVNKSYFKHTDEYLTQKDWTSIWKDCLKADYTPIVNVKAFKTGTKKKVQKSVAESAKYTVKDNDYLISNDEKMTDETVAILDRALANRRLVAFGGELRKIHKSLNLSDIEKASVHTDSEDDVELRSDVEYVLETYNWNIGYSNGQYVKSKEIEFKEDKNKDID